MNETPQIIKRNYYKQFFSNILRQYSFIIPLIILIIIFLSGMFINYYVDKELYTRINFDNAFINPSKSYIFGTNSLGQNLFHLILVGSYNTIKLATLVTFINVFIGIIFGVMWGHNYKMDSIMIFIKNILDNIPIIYFYILIISAIGSGFIPLLIVLTLFGWLNMACLIRNNLVIIRNKDYNKYSKLIKTPLRKITIHNYLPTLLPVIFNSVAISISEVTSLEITLSYFGFSIGESSISLGQLLYNSISNNNCFSHPFVFVIPLCFVFTINICYFYIGKAISSASIKEEKLCLK